MKAKGTSARKAEQKRKAGKASAAGVPEASRRAKAGAKDAPVRGAVGSAGVGGGGRAKKSAGDDGDDARRGDRSKRLLDLVMMLLRARLPVTYRDIRDQFTAYQTANAEAGLRAFERDKAELLELGVPIRYITPDEDDSLEDGGYVIDLRRLRLPEVHLTPDEVSALVIAASIARSMPGGAYPRVVDLALKKLAFDVPDGPDGPETPTAFLEPGADSPVLVHVPQPNGRGETKAKAALEDNFAALEQATRHRKRVRFTYQAAAHGTTSSRELDPYALVHREGAWIAVGYCHLRGDVRSFRLDRMRNLTVAPKPKSPDFERPATFDARAYANRSPWVFAVEPPEDVMLAFKATAADATLEDFGPGATRESHGDEIVVSYACTNPEFAVYRVLAAKGAITVRRGERLRQRLLAEAAAIAALYPEASHA